MEHGGGPQTVPNQDFVFIFSIVRKYKIKKDSSRLKCNHDEMVSPLLDLER